MGDWLHRRLEQIRLNLSRSDALLTLALMGLVTGVLAGGVIVAFRLAVEEGPAFFMPGREAENFEALPAWLRLLMPIAGGLFIGLLFRWAAGGQYVMGVARVMERLAYHQGYISLREFVLQFVGAAVSIVSGHSVGREGPHVYLGAAAGSLLGQRLSLPNNSIRTMVGCGIAAAIAASFNTPLAGVIFALEVVMMEYTLASFIPVILAAVSANAVFIVVFGDVPAFQVPALELDSLAEMPVVLVLGLAVGCIAALFIQLFQSFARHGEALAFWWRTMLAGLIVGLCALAAPEVMGIGYDTVNSALLGELGLGFLVVLVLLKVLASAACGGLGIPGGMIGPSLFIGAVAGGLVGQLAVQLLPGAVSNPGFYALLGMGAMMGASLQAPLAGLTAMVELTHNPEIIMPGMLVIVVAALTASELFGKGSIFITMLKSAGLDYHTSPVLQALRRVGVGGVMKRNFVRHDRMIGLSGARELLAGDPEWILVDEDGRPAALLRAVDLARHIEGNEEEDGMTTIDLMQIPAWREQVAPIHLQATLQEALESLDREAVEALYVERVTAPGIRHIYGVLTREQIESAYHY